jgi:methyl-accepting chemotaxis protein
MPPTTKHHEDEMAETIDTQSEDTPRTELELYKAAFAKAEAVCKKAAKGDLEARIVGVDGFGEVAGLLNAINDMLDQTDAFVREAGTSLQYASEGKFFRSFLLRGMHGDFRRGAGIINDARENMEAKAKAAAEAEAEAEQQRARERKQAEEIKQRAELAEGFAATVQDIVQELGSSAASLEGTANQMTGLAGGAHEQSLNAAANAEEATSNVETVAAATEELAASINEISGQVGESTSATQGAVEGMSQVNQAVAGLSEAAEQIEKVVEFIRGIAGQTNLLALNATIEAARAGEAGRGFAVVAAEVKGLAQQTAEATKDIGLQVSAIQDASRNTAEAISGIGKRVEAISEISMVIASAIEEQSAATGEISGNVQQAATGTRKVSESVAEIAGASEKTGTAADEVLGSAGQLSRQAQSLGEEVARFLEQFRAA